MEPEAPLLWSQQPATGHYPDTFIPYFPKIHFNITLPSTPRS
jgi:hypothetical protein